ncbi:hypothetical protein PR048_002170 [Dryococelus australis]|uniref:Uncharacterized protein n=1 Tax=Dryococelus australis TaxID=614101 RepID=A0ABQ9IJE8_9NEOP|nr:hypothetical protein PR048_002170 [Dryococelus australis]
MWSGVNLVFDTDDPPCSIVPPLETYVELYPAWREKEERFPVLATVPASSLHGRDDKECSPISTTARAPVPLVSVLELTIVLLVHITPGSTQRSLLVAHQQMEDQAYIDPIKSPLSRLYHIRHEVGGIQIILEMAIKLADHSDLFGSVTRRQFGRSFTIYSNIVEGRGGVVVRLLASHQGEPGSIPFGVAPGFSHVGIGPDDAADGRVFSGISRFPRPLIPALIHTRINHPHRLSRPRF